MRSLTERLERHFEFQALGADWKTEILAGATTFITMAYIIFVNPSVLHEAGMPFAAVVAATCVSSAIGSLLMGAYARYPIALAPGMGLNAYFAYVVVKGMGIPWQAALGAVFLSGIVFAILTLAGVIRLVVASIPTELYSAIAAGIGLFIALIGFRNFGIIVANPETAVAMGNLRDPNTLLAVFGLLLIAALVVAPAVGVIPAAATAPALIIVGSLMVSHISEIDWADPMVAIPAFLTMTAIPLTFSIANGLAFGFTAYALLRILRGELQKVGWFVYLLTALFIVRFLYLSAG